MTAVAADSRVDSRSGGVGVPPGVWVQLGAYRLRDGAEAFKRRVAAEAQWLAPALGVLADSDLYRLLAGPYRDPQEAHGVAQRVREAFSLVPMVVARR